MTYLLKLDCLIIRTGQRLLNIWNPGKFESGYPRLIPFNQGYGIRLVKLFQNEPISFLMHPLLTMRVGTLQVPSNR
jgi:hypothetical protein